MGFMEEVEEQAASDDWFKRSDEHVILGRPFEQVRIYMTGKSYG